MATARAGSAAAAEEPSLPTPPSTTAAARSPRAVPRQQQAATQQRLPQQSRRNVHRIPSTVDPRDMVHFEGSDDEMQISSSDDGNDQEYVQSDGEDDMLLQVGRSQPVGGRHTRGRGDAAADDAAVAAAVAAADAAERPNRRQRAPPRRVPARNEIDMRDDIDEDDYDSEDHMDAASLNSEVRIHQLQYETKLPCCTQYWINLKRCSILLGVGWYQLFTQQLKLS